jgi:hypothetical protein
MNNNMSRLKDIATVLGDINDDVVFVGVPPLVYILMIKQLQLLNHQRTLMLRVKTQILRLAESTF